MDPTYPSPGLHGRATVGHESTVVFTRQSLVVSSLATLSSRFHCFQRTSGLTVRDIGYQRGYNTVS
jgi:hypothetical protein